MPAQALDLFVNWTLRLTLYTIHFSTWMKIKCSHLFSNMFLLLVYSWDKLVGKNKEVNLLEVARNDSKSLDKIPKHYAAAILEDGELIYEDLSRLAVWCFAFGIHHVSLYDPKGKLKENFDVFKKAVSEQYELVFGPLAPSLSVTKSGAGRLEDHGVVESMYYVQVCSQEDSQNHLAQTAQYFCNAVGSGAISHSEINVAMVEQKWKDMYGSPIDPDLLVVFGDVSTTGGFPLWQMRFPEVHTLQTYKKLSYKEFFTSLHAFAKCKQNFGK